MKATRIDLEGRQGHYATIRRQGEAVVVEYLTPEFPQGRKVLIPAGDEKRLWAAAQDLQRELDGCLGTNSMVHEYFQELQRFAD